MPFRKWVCFFEIAGVFFENAGFVFWKMGVFSKIAVCFLKIQAFIESGCVFRKCGVSFSQNRIFFKNGSFFMKIRVGVFSKMRRMFFFQNGSFFENESLFFGNLSFS